MGTYIWLFFHNMTKKVAKKVVHSQKTMIFYLLHVSKLIYVEEEPGRLH